MKNLLYCRHVLEREGADGCAICPIAVLIRLEFAASVRYWSVRGFDNKR
jgi:hypothetical protein